MDPLVVAKAVFSAVVHPAGAWLIACSAGLLAFAVQRRWAPALSEPAAWACLAAGILALQAEAIFPGPYARVEWGDGGHLFLGYAPYLASLETVYQHGLFGGFDRFAIGRFGAEYLSWRSIAMEALPPWAPVVFLRWATPFVAAAGVYLLLTRRAGLDRGLALCFGFLLAVAYDFTATLTWLYGLTLAAVPLLAYMLTAWPNTVRSWVLYLVFALLFIGLADPFYILPSLPVFILAVAIWRRPTSTLFAVAGVSVLIAAWVLNFADPILAILEVLPETHRSAAEYAAAPFANQLRDHVLWLITPIIDYNRGGAAFALLLSAVLLVAAFRRQQRLVAPAAILVALSLFTPIAAQLPWRIAGLDFLATYRFYTEYVAIILAFVAAGFAVAALGRPGQTQRNAIVSVLIGLTVAYTAVQKSRALEAQSVRGNLTHVFATPNLAAGPIDPAYGRAIALPGPIDPNALPTYGLRTLQGAATFYNRAVAAIWAHGVDRTGRAAAPLEGPVVPLDWAEIAACCAPLEIAQYIDLDLFGMLNGGYVLGHRMMDDPRLQLVSGLGTPQPLSIPSMVAGAAQPVYVYRLTQRRPPAYQPDAIVVLPDATGTAEHVRRVAQDGPSGGVVLTESAFATLGAPAAPDTAAALAQDDADFDYGPDCVAFDIDRPGLWLVNIPPSRFWSAARGDNGATLAIAPANVAQMAIVAPPGTGRILLRYERKRLLDRLVGDNGASGRCAAAT